MVRLAPAEAEAVIRKRRRERLVTAVACAGVPKLTVIHRRLSYGRGETTPMSGRGVFTERIRLFQWGTRRASRSIGR